MLYLGTILITFLFLTLPIGICLRLTSKGKTSFPQWFFWYVFSSLSGFALTIVYSQITLWHYQSLPSPTAEAMDSVSQEVGLARTMGLAVSSIYAGFWFILVGGFYLLIRLNDFQFNAKSGTKP